MSTLRLEIPRKFQPLLSPKRYKGAYGGRGGAKSHFFAERAIKTCVVKTTRIVCIREIQDSIRDSVRQLLVDKIQKLGVGHLFEPLDNEIRGPNGSLIIFKGMQSYNAETIKSLEAYDIAWVEEAQTLSQRSLDMLRPTIRKEGSELWFSWNPRYKTDPVDKFFRGKHSYDTTWAEEGEIVRNPSEDIVSVMVNWRDNPWFPEVLRKDMERDFQVDPDKAESVWNGAYGSSEGAILSRWVNEAEREGRVNNEVVFDPQGSKIEVSSDLGFRDTASWWYWQRKVGGYALLKYDGDSGLDADDWIPRIQKNLEELGHLGKIWLPHDAKAKTFQSKHTSVEKFLAAFGANRVDIVPQSSKLDQISAARKIIKRCEFNREQCEAGIDGLLAWEFEYDDDNNVFSKAPLHNWASHPGDAFAYGAQTMEQYVMPDTKKEEARFIAVGHNTATLDDLWKQSPKASRRI